MTSTSSGNSKKTTINALVADPLSQFHMDKDELRLALVTSQYALRETRKQGQPTGVLLLVNGMELSGKGKAVTQLREWVDPRLLNVAATIGRLPSKYEPIWQAHTTELPRAGNITAYFGNWYADLIMGALQRMQQDRENAVHKALDAKDNRKQNKKDKSESKKSIDDDYQTSQEDLPSWVIYIQQQLQVLSEFEDDLRNNHTKLLKCWFHIDEDTLKARLKDEEDDPEWLYELDWTDGKAVAQFNDIAKLVLSLQSDWIVIDGSIPDSHKGKNKGKEVVQSHNPQASVEFCHHVLHTVQEALISSEQSDSVSTIRETDTSVGAAFSWADIPDKLTDIDDPDMDKSDYHAELDKKQQRLAALLRARATMLQNQDFQAQKGEKSKNKLKPESIVDPNAHHVIFAFEGMDAAGKGGAIKRLVAPLDPREYQIYNISAPTQIELQHPYLWRFWQRLPVFTARRRPKQLSRIAIFDRTWYGRVLVERIEGFASEAAWQRAYGEINRMERDLSDKGTIILKYWMAIDKQEQLERFESRAQTPHKQYKLTDDDWRNRDKWQDYVQAASDMLARTNTKYAPWKVVATNDKRTARLAVLDHAIEQLEKVVTLD